MAFRAVKGKVPWTGKAAGVWAFSSRDGRDGYNLMCSLVVEWRFARDAVRARIIILERE